MKKIILLGGGGHCRSCIDVIEQEGVFNVAGIVEKFTGESNEVLGYPIVGTDDDLKKLREKYDYAFITVGHIKSNAIRKKLFNKLEELNFKIPIIISPNAYVSKHAQVEKGSIIMHHALINAGAKVEKNCIINSKALIEHDSIIKQHTHISTGAIVNGGVVVKENTFYGSNSTSKENINIDGFIKAGSLVK